ncbi:MAG: biotin/lipoyl-binding protein [Gemmatimonadota bacterium]|nr:MAG: biotin/lipoyl-binding protein [Gemmatimonadota bacterium]
MKYYVEIGDRTYEVDIGPEGVSVDGRPVEADLQPNHGSHLWHLVLDGRSHTLRAQRRDSRGDWELEIDGRRHRALALDERSRAIRELAGGAAASHGPVELTAPMPGLIIKVEVNEEDRVERGQGLVVMEAMKMENELKANTAGRVMDVKVKSGQAVDKGQTLLVIEPDGGGD